MDPVVIKAWFDVAGEALALVFLAVAILAIIKLVDYLIKNS